MSESGAGTTESVDDGGGNGRKTGHRRLEGELGAFRAEFESLAAEVSADADADRRNWIARGRDLLDKADAALGDGRIEQGWYYLHSAERLTVYGIEAVGGQEALEGKARELLVEAEHSSLSWRADAVRERLTNDDGTLKEITGPDVRAAYELLHEGYQSVHLKRQHLQSQFRWLKRGAIVTIAAFVLCALLSAAIAPMPSPFFNFADEGPIEAQGIDSTDETTGGTTDGTGSSGEATDGSAQSPSDGTGGDASDDPVAPVGYLIYILLSGMLGASLFGLRSLRQRSASGSVPQYLTGFQVSLARLLVGASSALAVFFLLRAELLTVNVGAGIDSGPFLIALAFVAGYSERLVHTTVESVASTAESELPGGES